MAAPTSSPRPCTRFTTPLGMPASSRISTSSATVCGVSSAGLMTTVFPHTSAGNIFQVGMASGKLKGVMRPQTPMGRRTLIAHLFAQLRRHRLAEEAAALHAGVVGGVDALLQVAARLREHLAHLARGGPGDLVLALGEQVAHAAQDVAAGGGRHAAPRPGRRPWRRPRRGPRPRARCAATCRSGPTASRDCGSRSIGRSTAPPTRRR